MVTRRPSQAKGAGRSCASGELRPALTSRLFSRSAHGLGRTPSRRASLALHFDFVRNDNHISGLIRDSHC